MENTLNFFLTYLIIVFKIKIKKKKKEEKTFREQYSHVFPIVFKNQRKLQKRTVDDREGSCALRTRGRQRDEVPSIRNVETRQRSDPSLRFGFFLSCFSSLLSLFLSHFFGFFVEISSGFEGFFFFKFYFIIIIIIIIFILFLGFSSSFLHLI